MMNGEWMDHSLSLFVYFPLVHRPFGNFLSTPGSTKGCYSCASGWCAISWRPKSRSRTWPPGRLKVFCGQFPGWWQSINVALLMNSVSCIYNGKIIYIILILHKECRSWWWDDHNQSVALCDTMCSLTMAHTIRCGLYHGSVEYDMGAGYLKLGYCTSKSHGWASVVPWFMDVYGILGIPKTYNVSPPSYKLVNKSPSNYSYKYHKPTYLSWGPHILWMIIIHMEWSSSDRSTFQRSTKTALLSHGGWSPLRWPRRTRIAKHFSDLILQRHLSIVEELGAVFRILFPNA